MYKFLLANRYLRTRFIALASVISVTLGVATMIVVNSVMTGFSSQMRERIHGILADVMVETTSMDGEANPEELIENVEALAGRYIEAVTPTVEIYGMMSFRWMGQDIYRPVTLIGIVPETKNEVSPLAQYLLSRQRIVENDEVVREPLRTLDESLDWSLTAEGIADRKLWVKEKELQDLDRNYRQLAAPQTGIANAIAETQNDVQLGAPAPVTPAASSVIDDPFRQAAQAAAAEPIDPEQPLAARVYVGAGLISFPYKERETGKTRTMYMAKEGEDVLFTTIKVGQPQPISFKATIVDVFKSGMSEYDSQLVFCNLEELQIARAMLLMPADPELRKNDSWKDWKKGAITTLQIKLKDYHDAPEVVRRLSQGLGYHVQVRTWEQKQGPLLEAVAVESAILNVLLFLIITVAGFGILAIFYMIVVEKTRDIGILKSLGASSRGVMTIFLSYGLSLGVVGSGAGVALGLLFVHYINEIEELISSLTGHKVFDESIYYFHEIPTVVQPTMVIWVAAGAMFIAVLASVLPARRAASLHPVQALRYE
jgi:lipoprotein-releasing system permease protein